MRILMHLSDLHFCRIAPSALMALQESARHLAPTLIVVSGDLTQRARKHEFMAARTFLDALPSPTLAVPGNHDVPVYDLLTRFLKPHIRFQQHFHPELEPVFQDEELTVAGVNTARAFVVKGGRINREQVRRVTEIFCGEGDHRTRVLVTHHPFDLPLLADKRDLVGRAEMAMSGFGECMPDLLLAGHLHVHGAYTTAARYHLGNRSAVVVQAGTAISTRMRDARNSFNLIRVTPTRLTVDHFEWQPQDRRFSFTLQVAFQKTASGWERAESLL
jgi:3',5'-cyclic AMP phosphodiesterase CpdA